MIEGLKALEQYLQQNNMKNTLKTLRAELLCRIPNKPSQQFFSLFQKQSNPSQPNNERQKFRNQNPQKSLFSKKNKKQDLPVEGILGKIAYSSKLLEDNSMNEKINHLMDNKIFLNYLTKMFPEAKNNTTKDQKLNTHQQYYDELEMITDNLQQNNSFSEEISLNSNPHNQISGIDYSNQNEQGSIISQPNDLLEQFNKVDLDEEQYQDDRDIGYHEEIFDDNTLMEGCQELSKRFSYPDCAVRKDKRSKQAAKDQFKKWKQSIQTAQKRKFPKGMVFPGENDTSYPLEYNGVNYDVMKLKVIYDREKIGYEATKQLDLKKGDIIAGKYQVQKILGSGVFAKVIKAKDLSSQTEELTCFKMIQNDKDFLDQAFDELKILRYIKANCSPNENYLLNFKQVFYHREHLFMETDLLKDNLLTAFQNNPSYFSISVIRKISKQILQALATIHSLSIIHADLKPENIMIKSYNPIEVRVIDLGNGTFIHDQNLSNYVQSRSYRAPEVILGCGFNEKIDIWSVGCIVAQLWTKNVLFYNYHTQGMLARIQGIVGPWPQWMLQNGQNVPNIFSNENFIYYHDKQKQLYHIYIPKKTVLKNRLRCEDELFIDFVRMLTQIDPFKRVSALQALSHPFLRA